MATCPWNSRSFRLLALALCFSVGSPAFAAVNFGCTVNGGTGSGGSLCENSSTHYSTLTFHVTAHCTDNCDGNSWSLTSSPVTTSGFCNINCGTHFVCTDCLREITETQTELYTEARNGLFSLFGCAWGTTQRAKATCSCSSCQENRESPILISLDDGHFELTSAEDGVHFDLDGDGHAELTAWTAPGSNEAFLVLDRNQNGWIDDHREVFGNRTPQFPSPSPNGWRALAVWDDALNGGNEDGRIDAQDSIYASLQLWIDADHNGLSEASELHGLPALGVTYLDLDFKESQRQDPSGNAFRYWSRVGREHGISVGWDVFFVQGE